MDSSISIKAVVFDEGSAHCSCTSRISQAASRRFISSAKKFMSKVLDSSRSFFDFCLLNFTSAKRRISSYTFTSSGLISTRYLSIIFSGSSVSTSCLVRLKMNGVVRSFKSIIRRLSKGAIMKLSRNLAQGPSSPGLRNWNRFQSSARLFCKGVPVSMIRLAAFNSIAVCEAMVWRFFI